MLRRSSFFCCYGGGPNSRVTDDPNPDPIPQFSWREIESMTSSFTSPVIGEGGFSTVFLALLPHSSSLAAVKLHCCSDRLRRLFLQELAILRRLRHPHIVSLLGFSDDDEHPSAAPAAVFSLAPNGTLHDNLHAVKTPPLTWPRRVAIAFQIAKALEYLHDGCDPQIIHGDIKPSNVLLDANLDAKLCDFGSAVTDFESMVKPGPARPMTGSPGYVDPHYLKTGLVTKKSDVYGFGVLILELITGVEAVRLDKGRVLTAVMERRVGELVDPRLGEEYDATEAEAAAEVAAMCVGSNPSLRPTMAEVARVLEEMAGNRSQPLVRDRTANGICK